MAEPADHHDARAALQDWVKARIEELRPLEVEAVAFERAGSAPGWPETAGPNVEKSEPPRRYMADFIITLPATSDSYAQRVINHLTDAAATDPTFDGTVQDARIEVKEPREVDGLLEIKFASSVGFAPRD